MFTVNIPFDDALRCYENLIREKDAKDPSYTSLRAEFRMYAIRKADKGDSEAKTWLTQNNYFSFEEMSFDFEPSEDHSPLSGFSGFKQQNNHIIGKSGGDDRQDPLTRYEDTQDTKLLTASEIDEILKPIMALIGLENVKDEIHRIAQFSQIQKKRTLSGLTNLPNQTYHMIFSGNPGCGKTSVARLLGPIFKQLGITRNDSIIEVDRSDLVGEYIGETAQKTRRILEKAKGGILFIDEAYSLSWSDSARDFGFEAIATILKYMEDARDDLIVICAGYTQPMEFFVRSNPGLASRFPITIQFEDLRDYDLAELFLSFCTDHDFIVENTAQKHLPVIMNDLRHADLFDFANGRAVRSFFEQVLRKQGERLMREGLDENANMQLITAEDLGVENDDTHDVPTTSSSNIAYLSQHKDRK